MNYRILPGGTPAAGHSVLIILLSESHKQTFNPGWHETYIAAHIIAYIYDTYICSRDQQRFIL